MAIIIREAFITCFQLFVDDYLDVRVSYQCNVTVH